MRQFSVRRDRGFTLVEMLVAMAITVVMILALSQAFAIVGETVAQGRAAIEMSSSLRSVSQRLEEDLNGITVPVRPWADEGAAPGYFEIVDGSSYDSSNAITTPPNPDYTRLGDVDDILAFTTRSRGALFAGSLARTTGTVSITSPLAEVIWWMQNPEGTTTADRPFTIYRRALLIRPDLDGTSPFNSPAYSNLPSVAAARSALVTFLSQNDVSARISVNAAGTAWSIVPNTLKDLTLRQNRFAHHPTVFPHKMDTSDIATSSYSVYAAPKSGGHLGEDVMVSDALAFDVQVYDPGAPLIPSANSGEALVPSDPAYWTSVTPQPVSASLPTNAIGYGAFVDLGYGHRYPGNAPANWSRFSGPPLSKSQLAVPPQTTTQYAYCTWATYYERDGLDQDNFLGADQGNDGFDSDSQNGVDDPGERETAPPYATPLRGIQVRIRTWDRDSRQVRQATVVTDFVPE